jgi:hypothetical protein
VVGGLVSVAVLPAGPGIISSIENLLIQAPRLEQRLGAKFPSQNLLTVAVLDKRKIGAAGLHQVLHQQAMETLAAGIENEGFAIYLYHFSILA